MNMLLMLTSVLVVKEPWKNEASLASSKYTPLSKSVILTSGTTSQQVWLTSKPSLEILAASHRAQQLQTPLLQHNLAGVNLVWAVWACLEAC